MKREIKAFFRSFVYAAQGILHAVRTQRNMRFHLCAAAAVIMLMRFYELSRGEKCAVYLCIGGVIGAELINTAIEAAVDMRGREISPEAKAAKDCAAGAVLVVSICAAVCGIVLFGDIGRLRFIAEYFGSRPFAASAAAAYAAAAFVFIFGIKNGKG